MNQENKIKGMIVLIGDKFSIMAKVNDDNTIKQGEREANIYWGTKINGINKNNLEIGQIFDYIEQPNPRFDNDNVQQMWFTGYSVEFNVCYII